MEIKTTVSISIATYKRYLWLKDLVSSIFSQEIPCSWDYVINVNVVDNDIDASASSLCMDFPEETYPKWLHRLSYDNYTKKGLSYVRNRLIELAKNDCADYILFIDDDETVIPTWLTSIMCTHSLYPDVKVVRGPVIPRFDSDPEPQIVKYFYRQQFVEAQKLDSLAAGNTLIDMSVFTSEGLSFNPLFNETGGEDTFLGMEIIKKGGSIIASANAVAYEHVPAERADLDWLVKRNRRSAATFTVISCLDGNKSRFSFIVKIALLMAIASVMSVAGIVYKPARVKSRLLFAKAFGTWDGLSGQTIKEYK